MRILLMTMPAAPGDKEIQRLFERLALTAASEIMTIRAEGFDVRDKRDKTPVTKADMRAEAVIVDGLEKELPGVPHVGEEETSCGHMADEIGDCFVLVDPLDGTREFISGSDEFTVNIALVRLGVPEVGVVAAPALGVMYAARPGGAERISIRPGGGSGGREPISAAAGQTDRTRIVASRSHRTRETDAFIARYPDAEIVSVGSSLKFCMLAEGRADLYPRFGRTMEWDTAAGDAVLRAAGGRTRLVDGGPLTYGKRNRPDDCDYANPWFISEIT